MRSTSFMARVLAPLEKLPHVLQAPLRSLVLGTAVPYIGTSSLGIDELTYDRCVVTVRNRRHVRNHIGGVHAACMALMAETASGFAVAMNVPAASVPVIKTLKVDFQKRAVGDMRAVAELTPAQVELIRGAPKGETAVKVVVTDGEGKQPVACEMVWAWVPKRR
jgi:acyl-coenzyme A thioesterase PaaI-like protein